MNKKRRMNFSCLRLSVLTQLAENTKVLNFPQERISPLYSLRQALGRRLTINSLTSAFFIFRSVIAR